MGAVVGGLLVELVPSAKYLGLYCMQVTQCN